MKWRKNIINPQKRKNICDAEHHEISGKNKIRSTNSVDVVTLRTGRRYKDTNSVQKFRNIYRKLFFGILGQKSGVLERNFYLLVEEDNIWLPDFVWG